MSLRILFFSLFIILISSSCKDKSTRLKVLVIDFNKNPVIGIDVKVVPNVLDTGNLIVDAQSQITNNEGFAEFDYTNSVLPGQSGFAALDVIVIRDLDTIISTVDINPEVENLKIIQIP